MKKIYPLLFLILSLNFTRAQSVTPSISNEYCPNVNYAFTFSVTGQFGYVFVSPVAYATILSQGPSPSYDQNTNTTSYSFTLKFFDVPQNQVIKVQYAVDNTVTNKPEVNFTFDHVKSISSDRFISGLTPTSKTVQRCQIESFTVSLSTIKFKNMTTSTEFGQIQDYQYAVPAGWTVNGSVSSGLNDWKIGGTSASITTDLSTGDGSSILVRAYNSCAPSLNPGPTSAIPISRPAPNLTVSSTQDYICSGSANYTLNGMPTGSTVQWTVSNSTEASIAAGGTSPTVTVSRVGTGNMVITLTATVTHCTFTYTVTHDISLGVPPPNPIDVLLIDYTSGKLQVQSEPSIPGSTDYRWYKDGVLQTIYHSTFAQIPITRDRCDVGYGITVTETNGCGTSTATYNGVYVPCDGFYYSISPNPASNNMTISAGANKMKSAENQTFEEVRIYDLQGTLRKQQTFHAATSASVDVSSLTAGTWVIEIINANYKEKHQLLIQR